MNFKVERVIGTWGRQNGTASDLGHIQGSHESSFLMENCGTSREELIEKIKEESWDHLGRP